jgi:hypothetical protein
MTNDELVMEHHMAQKMSSVAKPHAHAQVSIEYAISVLEELKTKWEPVEFAHNFSLILESKIAGLKELIK